MVKKVKFKDVKFECYAFVAVALCLASACFVLGGNLESIKEMAAFCLGETDTVKNLPLPDRANFFSVVLAILAVLLASWLGLLLTRIFLDAPAVRKSGTETKEKKATPLILWVYAIPVFAILVTFEELVFRWAPQRILTYYFSGDKAPYFIAVISSIIFGLYHISGYRGWRSVAAVTPIMLGGMLDSYIFLKYGLLASIAEHFFWNMLCLLIARLAGKFRQMQQAVQH